MSKFPSYSFNFFRVIFHWPDDTNSLTPVNTIPISPLTSKGLGPVKYIEYLVFPIVPSLNPCCNIISPVLNPHGQSNSILTSGNIDLYKFITTIDSSDEILKYTSFIPSNVPPTWCAASPSLPAAITIDTLSVADTVDI